MNKILITGGAGFIGSNLVDYLLKKNFQIWVIDNFLTSSPENIKSFYHNPRFHFIKKNLITTDLQKTFDYTRFDIVYHLASPASPKKYARYPIETLLVNSEGTLKLLEYVKKTQSKEFIYASSSEIYGDPLIHPQTEDYWGNVNPVGERSCYNEGKRFGEALCLAYLRKYSLDIRIARIFNTYGPNMEKDDGRVISNFIVQALQDKLLTIYGDGQQTRSFCYVTDLVKGLYLMAIKPVKGEVINLGNDDERKIIEMAKFIKKITNSKSKIVFKPPSKDDPKKRKPNLDKAYKLLHWHPIISLEEGLNLTINYFRKRFYL